MGEQMGTEKLSHLASAWWSPRPWLLGLACVNLGWVCVWFLGREDGKTALAISWSPRCMTFPHQ